MVRRCAKLNSYHHVLTLSHSVLTTSPRGRKFYYPHPTDEKTVAQKTLSSLSKITELVVVVR